MTPEFPARFAEYYPAAHKLLCDRKIPRMRANIENALHQVEAGYTVNAKA